MASSILPASTGSAALDTYTQKGLDALAPGGDYSQTATYKKLQDMLGPGAGGGLNANLMAQYTQGQSLIGQGTQANVASAMSSGQGRGLGGSSIAAQGVESAKYQGTMAESSLMSSLYGQQNQNTTQLAGYLAQGSNQQLSDLLGIYESAGTSAANMQMYSQGLQEALSAAQASASATAKAGMWAGLGALGGGAVAAFSDVSLKKDIRHVGDVDGRGVYEFSYKADTGLPLPEGRHVGYLAHEVAREHPEAVAVLGSGHLVVKAPFLPVKVGGKGEGEK